MTMNLSSSNSRVRQFAPFLLVLVSAAIVVAAYLQALHYPFVSDDTVYITDNTKLLGLHLTDLWRLFVEPYNDVFEFLPVRDLSYWLDITLFGLSPSAFRIHNIILYLLCLPLAYVTTMGIWRYFRPADATGAPWAAAVVTVLFALHPALVESVVWISGRKYVLPTMFSILALWLSVRARRDQGLSAPHAVATLIVFVVVMFSKSSFVAVAPVIAMLWVLFWLDIPVQGRRRSQLLWPFAILFLAGLLTMIFISKNKGFDGMPFYFGVEAVTRTFAVLGWLARLAVSPESRHFFYPVLDVTYLPAMVTTGVVVLVAAVSGVMMIIRKRSLEGFALVTFLLLCMPYIQLIPNHPPSLVSDRYLALAVWPTALLIVALSWRLKPVPRTAVLLVFALSWGFQTVVRTNDWQSFEEIIDADLRAYPGYYMPASYKIGIDQLKRGLFRDAAVTANTITDPELQKIMVEIVRADYVVRVKTPATGKPQEAIELLWKLGLDLRQKPVQAQWNSPVYLLWTRCQETFSNEWQSLIKQFPDDPSVHYSFGLWKLEVHNYMDAITHLREATESYRLPESVRGKAFKSLGVALLSSGQAAEAEAPLRAALKQSPPDLSAYCTLSEVYKQSNRLDEAATAEADCRNLVPGVGAAR
jgi:tetratricopeptide (TPR) repeat protein